MNEDVERNLLCEINPALDVALSQIDDASYYLDLYLDPTNKEQPLSVMKPVIQRDFVGGTENVTFAQFAEFVVQDGEIATEIAEHMLKFPEASYDYNADVMEPGVYESHTVLDADELRRQIDAANDDPRDHLRSPDAKWLNAHDEENA